MRKKYKFRATASRQASQIDRFSNLPKEIAHHILSFLNFTELTQFGTLSKTCRQHYLSVPSLDFAESRSVPSLDFDLPTTKEKQVELLNSLDRYLFYRGDNRMHQFRIGWGFIWEISDENLRIIRWILNAVRCNVEELDLAFYVSGMKMFALPASIFLSQSLRSLSVNMKVILQVPSSLPCNLQHLKLSEVKIVDEIFFKWISFSCKCIKELQLVRIKGIQDIAIDNASLESFKVWSTELVHLSISGEKLKDIHIVWRNVSSSPSSKSFNISAPNLKYFMWEGNVMSSQNLGRFMNLEKAGIFMDSEVNNSASVFKVVFSVCGAKVNLNEQTVKSLVRGGSMPAPLDDIRTLGLHFRNLTDDLVPAVVSLLGQMPNLNTLRIKCTFSSGVANDLCSGCDEEYWKWQGLAFIHQLKDATLELSNGSNGIELARFILEHAENLDKMVIYHLLKHSDDVRELRNNNITSNATVISRVRKPEKKTPSDFPKIWSELS